MSGKLMPSERSYFASEDPLKGTPAEFKEAFDRFIGYYGKMKLIVKKVLLSIMWKAAFSQLGGSSPRTIL